MTNHQTAEKTPQRVQLSPIEGWRMPENTVRVDRATVWGNPFRVGDTVTTVDGTVPIADSVIVVMLSATLCCAMADSPAGLAAERSSFRFRTSGMRWAASRWPTGAGRALRAMPMCFWSWPTRRNEAHDFSNHGPPYLTDDETAVAKLAHRAERVTFPVALWRCPVRAYVEFFDPHETATPDEEGEHEDGAQLFRVSYMGAVS
jgi:hypothetical protein